MKYRYFDYEDIDNISRFTTDKIWLSTYENVHIFVAEDEKIIGIAAYWFSFDYAGDAKLLSITVDAEYEEQRIAEHLLGYSLECMKTAGAKRIIYSLEAENNLELFEKVGFRLLNVKNRIIEYPMKAIRESQLIKLSDKLSKYAKNVLSWDDITQQQYLEYLEELIHKKKHYIIPMNVHNYEYYYVEDNRIEAFYNILEKIEENQKGYFELFDYNYLDTEKMKYTTTAILLAFIRDTWDSEYDEYMIKWNLIDGGNYNGIIASFGKPYSEKEFKVLSYEGD